MKYEESSVGIVGSGMIGGSLAVLTTLTDTRLSYMRATRAAYPHTRPATTNTSAR